LTPTACALLTNTGIAAAIGEPAAEVQGREERD
jgi:hypothetical protein